MKTDGGEVLPSLPASKVPLSVGQREASAEELGVSRFERIAPLRLFAVTIATIFLAEIIAMIVVAALSPMLYYQTVLIDAGIMTTLIFPVLYLLSFRPVLDHIEQRRKMAITLEHSRDRLRRILDTIPDGIYILNQQYEIEYANPVIKATFGPNPGLKCYAYLHGRSDPCPWCRNEEVFTQGRTAHWEYAFEKVGKTYELFDTALINPDGSVSKLELLHDVTSRRQAEEELQRRNSELQTLTASEHKQRQVTETLLVAAQALTQTLDLDAVLRSLLRQIQALATADVAIASFLEDEALLRVRAVEAYGEWIQPEQILSSRVDAELNPLYQRLAASRRSLLIGDTAQEPQWQVYPGSETLRNWIFVPIVVEDKIIGVVGLAKTEAGYFTQEHLQWAEALVGQAAIAIQNAWLFQQVRAGSERLQSLSRRLVEIQETERRFVSRELHDQAGQGLTSLIIGLGALEREADSPQKVHARAVELKKMTSDVMEELHRLAVDLRPVSLDHLGLVPALEQLARSIAQDSGLDIRIKAVGIREAVRLSPDVETAFYRIAQEALNNVVRHAEAGRVDVMLERRGDTVLILVEDDGRGFNPDEAGESRHLGLLGIQERAETLGGKLTVESVPGKGTTLVVEVPYGNPNLDRR